MFVESRTSYSLGTNAEVQRMDKPIWYAARRS